MTPTRDPVVMGQAPDPAVRVREQEAAAAHLRQQVVDRLRAFSARHADQAWMRRHGDPIAAHALAFCYAEHGRPPYFALRTATRSFLDGPDVADPQRLLLDLVAVAKTFASTGRLDAREQMSDRTDPMQPDAFYVGIALSTLDTPRGRWETIRQLAASPLDIPGRCLAVLSDGTLIVTDRGPHYELDNFLVRSTHSLEVTPHNPVHRWRWAPNLLHDLDPHSQQVCQRLYDLHLLIWQAHHGR